MTSATTSNNKRQRRSREAWGEVLTRFAASGLEIEAFCAHEGLSVSSFRRWRSLLADDVSRGVELPAPGARKRSARGVVATPRVLRYPSATEPFRSAASTAEA